MSKKPAAQAAKDTTDAPKRSKLKLALFALAPLLLAGGGYAGWTQFLAGEANAETHGEPAAEGAAEGHGKDPVHVSAVPSEIAAETSFTHSFALSVILAQRCGSLRLAALKEASDAEARADGLLVNLSWQAAARRANELTEKSCGYLLAEIQAADNKALRIAEARLAAEKGDDGKPAAH